MRTRACRRRRCESNRSTRAAPSRAPTSDSCAGDSRTSARRVARAFPPASGARRTRGCWKSSGVDLEAQQTTFDAAVEQRVAAARVDADRLRERRIAGQHRRLPAFEMLAQLLRRALRTAPAAAPDRRCARRTADSSTSSPVGASLCLRQLLQLASLEVHEAAQLRALDILDRRTNRRRVAVVAAQDDASRRSCARDERALPRPGAATSSRS